ncbi:MAG: carboxypeptidase-like regulatory domain-containing protein, partial [Bacteroidota bacterium]
MKQSVFAFFIQLILFSPTAFAQAKFTVNGFVRDTATGESIIAATISVNGKTVNSNAYGFYSITVEEGLQTITVSHVSYQSMSLAITLSQNIEQNIFLTTKSSALSEVLVYSRKRDENVR